MLLGALLDLGVPKDFLEGELKKVQLGRLSFQTAKENRGGISGTKIQIVCERRLRGSFEDVERLIVSSALDLQVQERIVAIFLELARAEARVRNVTMGEVRFDELESFACLAETIGVVCAFEYLEIRKIYASPIPVGGGLVETSHGAVPSPAPVVVTLLEGIPVYGCGMRGETVTASGAAILRSMVESYGPMPHIILGKAGYGLGVNTKCNAPDILRIVTGRVSEVLDLEYLQLVETNIDNMNPEFYGFIMEKLLGLGVLDVTFTPIQMKKNRPGVLLSVLIRPGQQSEVLDCLFAETTTLGVRVQEIKRFHLERHLETLQTPYGPCQIKTVRLPSGEIRKIPEYESCREIANSRGIPIRRVYEEVSMLVHRIS